MTLVDLLSLSRDVTTTTLLLLAIWGSYKAWWVPGWIYRQSLADNDQLRSERDEYKRELFDVLGLADRSVSAAEEATDKAERIALERLRSEQSLRLRRGQQ